MSRTIVRALAALVLAAALGLLAGWLWWTWWGPPNVGKIYDTVSNGPTWYDISADGLKREFAGTAEFVVVTAAAGLVLGIVAGLISRGREIAFTAVVVLAGAVVGVLAWWLGSVVLSPPDPQQYATKQAAQEQREYPAHLDVSAAEVKIGPWDDVPLPTPFLAAPVAALLGYLVVLLSVQGIGNVPPVGSVSSETSGSEPPRSPAAS